MSQLHNIIEILADGAFHSGEEIGAHLGVSRSAVWKALKASRRLGIDIEVVSGRGYCIRGGLDLLDETKIRDALGPVLLNQLSYLNVSKEIESTNQFLLQHPELPPGAVCIAEQQLVGRGRQGRLWVSPFGDNIYLSMSWVFPGNVSTLAGLSLAVGVIIIDVLSKLNISGLKLKWPNDIMHAGKKLGGILIEINGDVTGPCRCVIGLGINTRIKSNTLAEIAQPATDLTTLLAGETPSRNSLAADFIAGLYQQLPIFASHGFAAFIDRWRECDYLTDKNIKLGIGNEVVSGEYRGIDATGNLMLGQDNGTKVIHTAEVRLETI